MKVITNAIISPNVFEINHKTVYVNRKYYSGWI